MLIIGLAFKANVKDTRNSKATDVAQNLRQYGVQVSGYDPLLTDSEIDQRLQEVLIPTRPRSIGKVDAVILTLIHNQFQNLTLEKLKQISTQPPVLIDVKSHFLTQKPKEQGFIYKCL